MNFSEFSKKEIKQNTKPDPNKVYSELKDLSSDELSKRLFDEVAMQKSQGTFDAERLLKTADSLSGYIPKATLENIKNIINGLR